MVRRLRTSCQWRVSGPLDPDAPREQHPRLCSVSRTSLHLPMNNLDVCAPQSPSEIVHSSGLIRVRLRAWQEEMGAAWSNSSEI